MNFSKERSEGVVRGAELGVEEVGLDEALKHTLSGIAAEEGEEGEFRPYTFLVFCFLAWLCIIGGGTIAYVIDTQRMNDDSDDIKKWAANMQHEGCPKYNHMESFHNKQFMEVAFVTFHFASMAIFTQRKRIGVQLCYDYTI